MKIVLIISSLRSGGAERVVTNLSQGLSALGHEVFVATYRVDREDFYSLPASVKRVTFLLEGSGRKKVANLRRCLDTIQPDIVISHINKTNIRTLLASRGAPWRVIVTEHNDPRQQPLEWNWTLLRHWIYRRASRLVGVSQGVLDAFPLVPRRKKVVIPNGVENHHLVRRAGRREKVIAVGRLVPIKGYDLLLDAFAIAHKDFPTWTLEIWGEGDERTRLEAQVLQLGLVGLVTLPGLTNEPFAKMAEADLLVCSSRSEGFGNVLVEAMSVGLPVVSFDCPCGPRDIIADGVNGFLVPAENVSALADAMMKMMRNEDLWTHLTEGAKKAAMLYTNQAVVAQWERLLT